MVSLYPEVASLDDHLVEVRQLVERSSPPAWCWTACQLWRGAGAAGGPAGAPAADGGGGTADVVSTFQLKSVDLPPEVVTRIRQPPLFGNCRLWRSRLSTTR